MKFTIDIPAIHCNGCVNLLKMSLEESFSNVEVDLNTKSAEFISDSSMEDVNSLLDTIFLELNSLGYSYSNLIVKD